ncbi:MAG TPA: LysM peptidoglycan-binding domain-containing protein [Anaerolineae bacterium]|nr:LysM peptidoglycan-binding domain-containing protein [Anaerolineae bacterium]MCB9107013.1 LysM peptidoglycan-binding domain-containing protein [Anaerolineales bacterium]HRV92801.1 LysM peptidoglycan-binding domain-containing protein [Anaerolineae bacterium]
MVRLSKIHYFLMLVVLLVGLTGCELRRDESDVSDPGPVSELPPTLAPLNVETNLAAEATVVPTVINVEPTATLSVAANSATTGMVDDGAVPTSIPIDLSSESSAITAEPVEEAVTEEFTGPADETTAEAEIAEVAPSAEEAIVVDATISDELPVGGPVAANPPYSATTGEYEAPAATAYGGSYTVQPGDTLFSLAQRFGTSVEELAYANGLTSDVIRVGQVLSVSGEGSGFGAPTYEQPTYQEPTFEQPGFQQPTFQQPYMGDGNGAMHVVAPGETLFRIALQYTTSVDAIAAANGIPYPYIIQTGQRLIVPTAGANAPVPGDGYYQQPPAGYGAMPPQPFQEPYQGYGAAPEQPYQEPYQDYGAAPQQPYQEPYQGYGAAPQQPYQEPYEGYGAAPQQPYEDNYGAPQAGGYYPPQDNTYANPNAGTHTIAPGETLFSIANRYGTSAEALAAANGLGDPNQIYVGQVLYLP